MRIIYIIFLLIFGVSIVMAEVKEKNEPTWYTGEIQHEGFPLHLRFPEKPDFDLLQKQFPKLLIVTHKLEKVTSTGIPESNYNKSLADFDHDLVTAFSKPFMGMTVLVETFGGNRTYYIYVSTEVDVDATKLRFSQDYPKHHLEWELNNDPNWKFIRCYSKDYNFY